MGSSSPPPSPPAGTPAAAAAAAAAVGAQTRDGRWGSAPAAAAAATATPSQPAIGIEMQRPTADPHLVAELVGMGFPKERAERALSETNNNDVNSAVEWILNAESSKPKSLVLCSDAVDSSDRRAKSATEPIVSVSKENKQFRAENDETQCSPAPPPWPLAGTPPATGAQMHDGRWESPPAYTTAAAAAAPSQPAIDPELQRPTANPQLVAELVGMGFPKERAERALSNETNNSDISAAIEWILNSQPQSLAPCSDGVDMSDRMWKIGAEGVAKPGANVSEEDKELRRAIEESLKTASGHSLVSNNPFDQLRENDHPVGLKNVGNTCWINSLLAAYFRLGAPLMSNVMRWDPKEARRNLDLEKESDDAALNRVRSAYKFLLQLRLLFARLHLSKRKFLDPSKVVNALFKFGNTKSGEQQDVVELNELILSSMQTAFDLCEATKGTVERLFYGSSLQRISAEEADGSHIEQDVNVKFATLIIAIDSGDLVSALDSYIYTKVPQYQTRAGHFTTAKKAVWFHRFPRVLTFQLQRAHYDPKRQRAIKINSKFEFPLTFSTSRYLLENKVEVLKRLAFRKKLRESLALAMSTLEEMDNFKNSGVAVTDALSVSLAAVSELMEADPCEAVTSNALMTLLNSLTAKRDALREQIAFLQRQIDGVFEDMADQEYSLLAVMVHEGSMADTGHYWAYLRKHTDTRWYKFDDQRVTEEEHEQVLKQSFGSSGDLNSSAYFLVYVRSEDLMNDAKLDTLIPPEVWASADADNAAFKQELDAWTQSQGPAPKEPTNAPTALSYSNIMQQQDESGDPLDNSGSSKHA